MIPEQFRKAVTFSYDDGNTQDIRLVELFNQYGMKCTFNLNSGLNESHAWEYRGSQVTRLNLPESAEIYQGHEIAVHGLQHRNMTELSSEELYQEIFADKQNLTEFFGREPVGMAYPYGAYHENVIDMLRKADLKYARTVNSNHSFAKQEHLLEFCPTCHHDDALLFDLAEKFLRSDSEEMQIFYIWGHSYEFDGNHNWDRFEKLLDMLAGKSDIFYGTNAEVLLP